MHYHSNMSGIGVSVMIQCHITETKNNNKKPAPPHNGSEKHLHVTYSTNFDYMGGKKNKRLFNTCMM